MNCRWSGLRAVLAMAALIAMGVSSVTNANAQDSNRVTIDTQNSRLAGEFHVAINKSQVLRVDVPFAQLSVGNPKIADVQPLTSRSIYVLGKALGSTNLAIYGPKKNLIAVVDLVVTYDVQGLKRTLFRLLPKEKIDVRSEGGALVMSGTVSSSLALSTALSLAKPFVPKGQITNLMQVRGSQQVMLSVRIAEMKRTVAKKLGLNTHFIFANGRTNLNVVTGDGVDATSFASGLLSHISGNFSLSALFDALEQRSAVKTLAEPNLVAMSGDTAKFLAGGEFPIPVAQSSNGGNASTISVQYKQFGVGLAFTPTVLADGLINLVVNPEVSTIDPSLSVPTGGGIEVPGLKVRRATTTIELHDGQSFAIAGLLQNDLTDQVRKFPWLGDVPILGTLFRSTQYQNNETELVILVTPHLVQPAPAGSLAAPTDFFVPPSESDLFWDGRLEASGAEASGNTTLQRDGAGGFSETYGHIVK